MDVTAVGGLRFGTITAIPAGGRQGQQFAVAQDQQLEGTVVSIDHESVVIQVGNQRMKATTDASVRPGDVLRLLVRATGPDQVLMQIVGRGGTAPVQTRSLTRQELSNELTRLGVAPDDESLQVAGELLGRGQPLTAANVLEVRSALARVAQARAAMAGEGETVNQADLRAAVFLKAQGLPVTKAAVQIVRQAWSSGSALGQEVEELRDSLASLASRLTGLVDPEPVAGTAPARSSQPTTSALPPGQEGGEVPDDASASGGRVVPQPANGETPTALAPPQGPESTSTARPHGTAAGPPPAATGQAAATQPEQATASAPSATPAAQPTDGAESAPLVPPSPSPPLPASPAAASPAPATLSSAASPPSGEASPAVSSSPPGPPNVATSSASAAPTPAPVSAPPFGRLLAAIADSLAHLQMVDDEAVAGSRAELADRIRQVVAEQGTPVEAKLARVLEGLADRPAQIDRALVADLRTALADLAAEVGRHLDQPDAARRLPAETLRSLESVRSHAESLLGRVELQQLTNASAATSPAPTPTPTDASYLMFQLPIPGRQDGQTAQIRIQQQEAGGAKRIDPNNVHVVFQFEMQHLGTVRVDLRLLERRVSCQMGSSDPTATALLDRHAAELREGLGELGYVVDTLRCTQLTPADLRAPDSAASAPAATSRPTLRVDARA